MWMNRSEGLAAVHYVHIWFYNKLELDNVINELGLAAEEDRKLPTKYWWMTGIQYLPNGYRVPSYCVKY